MTQINKFDIFSLVKKFPKDSLNSAQRVRAVFLYSTSEVIMARPKIDVDEQQVFKLAKLHCSNIDIAEFTGISTDTLTRRFAKILSKGRQMGKINLRRAQFKTAFKGNPTLLVWLGKQCLGQKDMIEVVSKDLIEEEIEFVGMPKGKVNGRYKRFYN